MRKLYIIVIIAVTPLALLDCRDNSKKIVTTGLPVFALPDTAQIPGDHFGEMVRYGRELIVNTAYYIGPDGIAGKYLGNRMNCTNCHQDAGTKPFSFNLMISHSSYPQYRQREGKVLSLAERVNNCVMHPHNGKPLPLDSKEMVAILSYLKWINSQLPSASKKIEGLKNLQIDLPNRSANSQKGAFVYQTHCQRCHGKNGEGYYAANQTSYTYPLLWGDSSYQPGSSMHRNIKLAQWLKANMPFDSAKWNNPVLTDEEALDVAAFINDDQIHPRPKTAFNEYPNVGDKPIDYPEGPFIDSFSAEAHKLGPYKPIIDYWKSRGLKPVY